MNQDLIKDILSRSGIRINARRPLDADGADGYLESDRDFILNNQEAIVALLDEGGLERLAKLIVLECAQLVNDNNFAGSTLGDRLFFEHFGIKE